MNNATLTLDLLPDRLCVCRLAADASVPALDSSGFVSATRTQNELSIVCAESSVPPAATIEAGWHALCVRGPLDFALTGVLARIAQPLAAASIPIFAISTFDTDYVLVKQANLDAAIAALREAGIVVNH